MKGSLVLFAIFLFLISNVKAVRIAKRSASGKHANEKHWGYRNEDKSVLPSNWHQKHPACYGKQQSPINIESHETIYDQNLTQIAISSIFKDSNQNKEIWNIKNNGHSVVISPINKEFSFKIQPEKEEYKLLQMHFHWRGSEHYVDGHRFAAELHLVHQNVKDDGKYAVLGFLFRQSNQDNVNLNPIIDKLKEVITYGSAATETNLLRLDKLLPTKVSDYYRYSGSLTTPGCDEVVEWFVLDNPVLTISDEQVLSFQSVEDNHGYPILSNARPIQDINFRTVRRSFGESIKPLPKSRNILSASGHTEGKTGYDLCSTSQSFKAFKTINFIGLLLFFNIVTF